MIQSALQKMIVSIVVLALLAVLGYFVYNSAEVSVDSVEFANQDVLGQEILILADKVDSISFDQSVFSSNVFLSLIDYKRELTPEVEGKSNPFAPIGLDGIGPSKAER